MVDPFVVTLMAPRLGTNTIVGITVERFVMLSPVLVESALISRYQINVQDIKAKATNGEKVLENFEIFIKDEQDRIVAIVTKTIYVRLKERFR